MSCLYCPSPARGRGLCSFHYHRWQHRIPFNLPKHYDKVGKKGSASGGYLRISVVPQGRRYMKHRLIIEEVLGRQLAANEVVHHKNGDKLDNRLENLEVMDRAAHTIHHQKRYVACSVAGCDRTDRLVHNLCSRHYQQQRSRGYTWL